MTKGKSFDNKISSKLATAQISAAQHKHKSISQSHHLYCHPSSFADTLLLFYFFILNVLLCQFVVVLIVVLLAGISSFAPVVLSGFVCTCSDRRSDQLQCYTSTQVSFKENKKIIVLFVVSNAIQVPMKVGTFFIYS